jgi:hypothetical protein
VAARGGDFEGASGQCLAAYISEVRGRCGRRFGEWLGWGRSRATSRQDLHGLAERRVREDIEARDDRGLPGVGEGEDDAANTITTRLRRDREDASYRSDRAVERQLAEDDGVVDLTGGDEPGRCQHPEAIGRSKTAPTLRMSAGERLTVTWRRGNSRPEFRMALCTRSRLSRTLASGSPTMVMAGSPPSETSTSTRTGKASTPKSAAVRRMASTGG